MGGRGIMDPKQFHAHLLTAAHAHVWGHVTTHTDEWRYATSALKINFQIPPKGKFNQKYFIIAVSVRWAELVGRAMTATSDVVPSSVPSFRAVSNVVPSKVPSFWAIPMRYLNLVPSICAISDVVPSIGTLVFLAICSVIQFLPVTFFECHNEYI